MCAEGNISQVLVYPHFQQKWMVQDHEKKKQTLGIPKINKLVCLLTYIKQKATVLFPKICSVRNLVQQGHELLPNKTSILSNH